MGDRSKIEWTEATWNPVVGCSVVSPGCTNCYAMKDAWRKNANPRLPRYHGLTKITKGGPVWTGEVRTIPELLDWPLRKKKPLRIFVNSMSDLFHEDVPDEFIDKVFAVMALSSQHTFQILTKRAERMLRWATRLQGSQCAVDREGLFFEVAGEMRYGNMTYRPWPLPNVWLLVSVEDQPRADERIPLLLQTPAAVRGISAEPLIGPIDLRPYFDMEHCQSCGRPYPEVWYADNRSWNQVVGGEGGLRCPKCFAAEAEAARIKPTITIMNVLPTLDWVVVGGESGPGARPFDIAWARSLRDQCRAAGVPFFMKQTGTDHTALYERVQKDRKGGDMAEWPEDLRVREYPRA